MHEDQAETEAASPFDVLGEQLATLLTEIKEVRADNAILRTTLAEQQEHAARLARLIVQARSPVPATPY